MNRGSLHTRRFRHIHFSAFMCRLFWTALQAQNVSVAFKKRPRLFHGSYIAFLQTFLTFSFKCHLASIRTVWSTQQQHWGLYQNKVTCSLDAIQRPRHWTDNWLANLHYQLADRRTNSYFIRSINELEWTIWHFVIVKANWRIHAPVLLLTINFFTILSM